MLTDPKTLRKLARMEERYAAYRFEKIADVPMEFCELTEHLRDEPDAGPKVKYRPAPPGTAWGGEWLSAWFRGDVRLPKMCDGRPVFVRARTGGTETMFFVDGEARGLFNGWHTEVLMAKSGVAGRKYHIALEAYAGHSHPSCGPDDQPRPIGRKGRTFAGAEIVLAREDVLGFTWDLKALLQLVEVLDENSLRRSVIIAGLAKVWAVIDAMPAESPESSWRPKLAAAREIMRPLLAAKNGDTTPRFGIIGHSHLDTAWLWPLSETWRKAGRTFSSMLNLMEQYPEALFIQTAPCHTEIIRDEYPGIYRRIKEMVAAGRWEPNGAMWVEPDCNVPSGESFVRQLLIGQNWTRSEFGYTSDTFWVPDVFGFSAALPQLLRGAGVEFFCTTKLSWSDVTRFPYDTFVWKGIDGSSVLAHFNVIQASPDPKQLVASWNNILHKDVQDRRLLAYGWGDGGGGPMAEMFEMARRTENLEGCPRTRNMTVSAFMRSLRDELTNLPEWSGELYLQYHRGVQTSIAKTKRGNRKAEFALRDAEFLSTLASLRGTQYPTCELLALWKELLTNQFHDILPGSSIARVNDEAAASFERLISHAQGISRSAMTALFGGPPRRAASLMLTNTLSWHRGGEFVIEGAPARMLPKGAIGQWYTNVEGRPRLALAGISLPAMGAAALSFEKRPASGASPFSINGDVVETPSAVARFDAVGRIVSLADKATGREIVRAGGVLNGLISGQDVPLSWDSWDIDDDQKLKMRPEERLLRREVVADGPLQLRIRSTYTIGAGSTLTQDVVFHSTSARIDFESVLDWSEKHTLLKAVFDVDVLAETARHEIQFGHIERPTHRNLAEDRAQFEVPAHKWTDLSDNGFGVALLNDCKYGVSVIGGQIGLSLIKSGTHPDPRGDEGRHLFTYALLPHSGGFSVESVVRPAYELNSPVVATPAGQEAEDLDSLVIVDSPTVIVESVKWAERSNAFVLRLYEAGKMQTRTRISFGTRVKSVDETDLLEEKATRVSKTANSVEVAFRPFEVKTLVCKV